MGKKCPYCGQSLSNVALKCTRCKKWVDNEIFNRLCDDDVKLIKNKDLTPFTPTLLAMMVIDLLKKEGLKESAQKLEGGALNEKQQFNLLVFNSFCFFKAICSSVKIKQGRRDAIKGMLKLILLKWSAQLFNSRVKNAPSWEVLMERGIVLYAKFEAAWLKIPWEAGPASQMEAADAFASAIYADDDSNLLRGLNLWAYFMETVRHMREAFSKIFLVEEEDFDWRAIGGI